MGNFVPDLKFGKYRDALLDLVRRNTYEFIFMYIFSFVSLFFLFTNNNFSYQFKTISSALFPLIEIQSLIDSSIFNKVLWLLVISFYPLINALIFVPILNFSFYNTSSSDNQKKLTLRLFFAFFIFLFILANVIVYTEGTFSNHFLLVSLFAFIIFFLNKQEKSSNLVTNSFHQSNKLVLLLLAAFYMLFIYLSFSLIGPAHDIHVDESLYLTLGRYFSLGVPALQISIYPTLPFILSFIISFTQNIATISSFLIFLHGSIVFVSYKFVKSSFNDSKLALLFSFTTSISPLLLLYSNRAFIDLIALIFILLTIESIIMRRSPFLVAFLGFIVIFSKAQYLLMVLFFLIFIFFPIQNKRLQKLIPSFREKNFKQILQLLWTYNVTFENWLARVIVSFICLFTPFFAILKASLILGDNTDPNTHDVKLLDINTINNHLQQYYNWSLLKTIWIHNGNVSNQIHNFLISDIWLALFLIVSIYALYETIKCKELSFYFLPLFGFLFMFLPQLILLSRIFQRYAINFHVLIFLLTIVLGIDLFLKGLAALGSLLNSSLIHSVSQNIKLSFSSVIAILLVMIIFMPVLTSFYPNLQYNSLQFDKPGFVSGVNFFKSKYSTKNVILGVDDGWRAGWYFPDYSKINIIFGNGWNQFYYYCLVTNSSVIKILFVDVMEFNNVILQNDSYFYPIHIFDTMGIYQFNSSLIS